MTFERAFAITIGEEGGASDNKSDRGGHTFRGVTQRRFTAWLKANGEDDRDVITMTEAELRSLAFAGYWKPSHADALSDACGCLQFDAAFNHGPANAIRLLQEACGAEVDGAWGPETAAKAVNATVSTMLDARLAFYQAIVHSDSSQIVFLRGWTNRIEDLRKAVA